MRPATLFLALVACSAPEEIPKEDFPYWAADVYCDRLRECMQGTFESLYFGTGDCRESIERLYLSIVDANDDADCDYSAAEAGDAYGEISEMSCERFYEGEADEAIVEVWDDCGFLYPPYTYYGYTFTY